jgi:cell division transport system ATP-binding protein
MINLTHVSKQYTNGQYALKDINLHIGKGEMVFLTGHSGAGKSTLLKLLLCQEVASQGQVEVAGRNLNRLKRRQIPYYRRRIGVVFQNHRLLFDRSVFANVALPLVISGYSEQEQKRRVRGALDKVGLIHKERTNPADLSSGEQQRVGIARAVINKPDLLLADEPTGNLDPQLSKEIMELFADFNQVGTTVMVASHDLALIARLRHPMLTLNHGRLVSELG